MEYLNEKLNKAIEKAAEEIVEKTTIKRQLSVKEMLNEMDKKRILAERYSNRWWRKNMNLDEQNLY